MIYPCTKQRQSDALLSIQNSYRHSNSFFRTCKDQIPGFSRTQKSFFSRTFQETFYSKHWLHEVKKFIYKIGYRCICIKVKKRKYNNISNNRFDPRGGAVLKSIAYAYLLSDYSKHQFKKIQKRCFRMPFSRTFQGLYEPCQYQIRCGVT